MFYIIKFHLMKDLFSLKNNLTSCKTNLVILYRTNYMVFIRIIDVKNRLNDVKKILI